MLPFEVNEANGLTDRQRDVVACIAGSLEDRGYPPSMREIGQAVGLSSTSSVAHQLMALERKGFMRRDPHRPRAYCLPRQDAAPAPETETGDRGGVEAVEVPVVGRTATGTPILAEEMIEDTYALPRPLVGEGDLIALKLERRRVRSAAPCGSCGSAGRLRIDRIVDEARHSADPVRLMELFGLSTYSATRYVLSAHPDKKPGPIAP